MLGIIWLLVQYLLPRILFAHCRSLIRMRHLYFIVWFLEKEL
uniref:Sodium/hydrogen exchanger n=1 Tax=Rhizophora mucronata TaxID=61149 RepID=A0A2P2L0H6_RHIMU